MSISSVVAQFAAREVRGGCDTTRPRERWRRKCMHSKRSLEDGEHAVVVNGARSAREEDSSMTHKLSKELDE
jgi:hypothetical protein